MVAGAAISLAIRRTVEPVRGIHRAVAGRGFGYLGYSGPVARPIELWHNAVSELVYGSIRVGANLAGHAVDASWQRTSGMDVSIRAVVCGLWGDHLDDEPRLRQPMVLVRSPSMDADDRSSTRLAILVHGLMRTERCWDSSDERPGLVEVLMERTDVDPVMVRYNSGRPIADNGAILSRLLEDRFGTSAGVESVDLIGHSMGGLVARASVEQGLAMGHGWIDRLRHVITLGTPHGGTPIEKGLHTLSRALDVSRTSRPLADYLDRRSAGIKDLRHGTISRGSRDSRVSDSRDPSGQRFVAGLVTSQPRHPFGRIAGDLLVRRHSAEGGGISPEERVLFTGTTHGALLDHQGVADQIVRWLS